MTYSTPTLWMMYPARGGLDWGQMRGCYLKSGGLHRLSSILAAGQLLSRCHNDIQYQLWSSVCSVARSNIIIDDVGIARGLPAVKRCTHSPV